MSATIDTAAIVLGMHRSGTSALTRVLSLHGFDLPRTLIPASNVNERGFWESPQVNALNNEILASMGQNWFSFSPIPQDWTQSDAAATYVERARTMLTTEFGSAHQLLLKDPRICRLAGFWQLALQSVADRLVIPIILRNPVEVARSLGKRNGFDESLGKLLWLRYCLDAEAGTRGLSRTFINYQDLLDDWRTVMRRVDIDLSLSLEQSTSIEQEVDAFLSADLQHHRIDDSKALADISVTSQLHTAYEIMHRWGSGAVPTPEEFQHLDHIRAALDTSAPLFVSLVESGRLDRKNAVSLKEQIAEKQLEFSKARAEIETGRRALLRKKAELGRTEAKLSKSKANLAKVQLKKDNAERGLSQALDEIAAMKATPGWRLQVTVSKWAKAVSPKKLTRSRSKSRQKQRLAQTIRSSEFFDAEWYLGRYPDVRQGSTDPVLHYLNHGWKEGRDPGPRFSTDQYLRENRDVAAAGINPLLHFIEYGLAEGRETSHSGRAISRKSTVDFGPAHPCFHVNVPRRIRPTWLRAHDLSAESDRPLVRSNVTVFGFAPEQDGRSAQELEHSIELFRIISGAEKSFENGDLLARKIDDNPALQTSIAPALIDAWFVNDFALRTRWRSQVSTDQPFVLRAYQCDGETADNLLLCGESLLQSELDCADVSLINPFMPVLFIESTPDGIVRSSTILSFPSLCRAGLYYGELLAINERSENIDDPIDIIGICHALTADMLKILSGETVPLLSHIGVDLRDGDGTEAIFQPELQQWLNRVARIDLAVERTDSERAGETIEYLTKALQKRTTENAPHNLRKNAGTSLLLPADAVPSLQVLTASSVRDDLGQDGVMAGAYLFCDREAATPKKLVTMPSQAAGMGAISAQDIAAVYPIFRYSPGNSAIDPNMVAAIRIDKGRTLHDAELIMPVAPSIPLANGFDDGGETLAIFWPEEWESSALVAAIEAVAAQTGSGQLSVLLLADAHPDDGVVATCDRLFGTHWQVRSTLAASWDELSANYVLVIRRNILLHDVRTLITLKHILADARVSTATCAIVRADEGGKSRKMTDHSGGLIRVARFGGEAIESFSDFAILRRATYPIANHSVELWMATIQGLKTTGLSPLLFNHLQHPSVNAGEGRFNLCTTTITASLIGEPAAGEEGGDYLSPESSICLKVLNG